MYTENLTVQTCVNVTSVTLNRPKALNALTRDMIDGLYKLYTHLLEHAQPDFTHIVILKGAAGKALCAGGDVKGVTLEAEKGNWMEGVEFFRAENTLDYLISRMAGGSRTVPRPCVAQVAIMDGIVMGGGAGLSMHGPFRIATERTVFSMPETAIGFFPDVGACSFLTCAPCTLGLLLGLSGRRLRGRELLWAGLATHFVHSSQLPAMEATLVSAFGGDNVACVAGEQKPRQGRAGHVVAGTDGLHVIDGILKSYQEPAAVAAGASLQWLPPGQSLQDVQQRHAQGGSTAASAGAAEIPANVQQQQQRFSALLAVSYKHFARSKTVSTIIAGLEEQCAASLASGTGAATSQVVERQVCQEVLDELRSMSPMSLELTFKLYKEAQHMSTRQVLDRDFRVTANCTKHGWDFHRGVRSKLIEKKKQAEWMHSRVEDVPAEIVLRACREPEFTKELDLSVVDRMFEGSGSLHMTAPKLQARL